MLIVTYLHHRNIFSFFLGFFQTRCVGYKTYWFLFGLCLYWRRVAIHVKTSLTLLYQALNWQQANCTFKPSEKSRTWQTWDCKRLSPGFCPFLKHSFLKNHVFVLSRSDRRANLMPLTPHHSQSNAHLIKCRPLYVIETGCCVYRWAVLNSFYFSVTNHTEYQGNLWSVDEDVGLGHWSSFWCVAKTTQPHFRI